ncbi:RNA 2',3'-cyclic phosphodiesterase [Nocardia sp. NPDC127579]|uniref:RNA 2',3'-cyclic phosphodiesterase n=1 Tax=Nocardia sp. NPDC127579 TaxID=3345402 RepID=UPI003626C90C
MRLFAAVLPPETVLAELAAAATELRTRAAPDRLRWTGQAGWHFTLAFYGEVDDALVSGLSTRLRRVARASAPFELALRGGGRFEDRVLWAGVTGDLPALRALAAGAVAAGRRAGLDLRESRSYRPHLTLARASGGADFTEYVTALADFAGQPWTVREICLIRSRLPRSGIPGEQPRYETVDRWPLS